MSRSVDDTPRKNIIARLVESLKNHLTLRQVLTWPALVQVMLVALALGFISIRQQWLDTNLISTKLRDDTASHFLAELLDDLHSVRKTAEQNALNLRLGVIKPQDSEAWQRYLYAQSEIYSTLSASFLTTVDGLFIGFGRSEKGEVSYVEADPALGGATNVYELDESGRLGQLRRKLPEYDAHTRPWWQHTIKAKAPVWTLLPDSILFYDAGIAYSVPVFDERGDISSVCVSRVGLHKLSKLVNDLSQKNGAALYLLDRDGRVVVCPNPDAHPETPTSAARFPYLGQLEDGISMALARKIGEAGITPQNITGPLNLEMRLKDEVYRVTIRPMPDMPGLDWIVVCAVPTSAFLKTLQENFILATLLAGLAVIAAGVLGRIASRWVLSPISELRTEAARVASDVLSSEGNKSAGKLKSPTLSSQLLNRHDELGDLARVFQDMVHSLMMEFNQQRAREQALSEYYRGIDAQIHEQTKEFKAANASLTHEISEHRITEAALRRAHGQLRAVFDAMPGMIFVIDKDFNVIDASERYLECLRPQAEAGVIGQKCHQIIIGSDEPCAYCQTMLPEQKGGVACRLSSKKEEEFFGHQFKVYSAPITDEANEIWGYVECVMDISDLRRMEQYLHEARLRAEAASDAKTNFLANVSHEIRTPLTGILGLADLIEEGALDEPSRDNLRLLRESGSILLGVINDVLDLSKIEAGTCVISEKQFSLRNSLDALSKLFAPQMKGKPVRLSFHVSEVLPDLFLGDAQRLRQILLNLIGNAVKFTSSGSIQVLVEPASLPLALTSPLDQLDNLLFSVRDTGCGIPDDYLDDVFESFTQADTSTSRRHAGTGLGLAISKRLVELMGGQIWVHSKEGKGATFYFTVRLKPMGLKQAEKPKPLTPAAASAQEPSTWVSLRILVAEDNHINQRLMERLLSKRGHAVTVVEDGAQAIKAANAAAYDVIFMDIQMPGTDGIQATKGIRESQGPCAQTPIIALTAHALSGDKDRFMAEGFSDYLSKPLDRPELERVLRDVTRRGENPEPLSVRKLA